LHSATGPLERTDAQLALIVIDRRQRRLTFEPDERLAGWLAGWLAPARPLGPLIGRPLGRRPTNKAGAANERAPLGRAELAAINLLTRPAA